jgi:queuine tRNA-ribosyltransferase
MIGENPRYGTISERGIHFTDIDGNRKKVLFTPARSIRLQFDLGADLMVCLDDCPSPDASPAGVELAVERTILWAKRCKEEFDRLLEARGLGRRPLPGQASPITEGSGARSGDARPSEGGRGLGQRRSPIKGARSGDARPSRPLLFGVIQGGYDKEMRERCAEALLPLGFDGFGFGGWPLTPEGDLVREILAHTAGLVPDHLPRFALGVGKPEHIVRCYGMGWRIFDCVLPTRDARHGRLYVFDAPSLDEVDLSAPRFYHFLYVRDEKHKRQKGPVSRACDCPCCRQYSLAYLHHLFDVGDPLGLRLATMHNLRFYTQLLARI